jgi:hypothetical protein
VEACVEELTVELVVVVAAAVVFVVGVVDKMFVTIQEQADDIRDGTLEHCET